MAIKLPKYLAFLAISPFLLGFAPPEEPGTYVSASAGKGRFVSSPGCARPQVVDFTDQQVGVYHQRRFDWKATRVGVGMDLEVFESRQKECTEDDCRNADTAWHGNRILLAASPYATVDWKWAGLSIGGYGPLQSRRGGRLGKDIDNLWLPIPGRGSLRLGSAGTIFASVELQSGQPLNSGGSVMAMGLGGRLLGTDLWLGTEETGLDGGFSGRIGRGIGPVRVRMSGRYAYKGINYQHSSYNDLPGEGENFTVKIPEYAVSAGLDYRLPW